MDIVDKMREVGDELSSVDELLSFLDAMNQSPDPLKTLDLWMTRAHEEARQLPDL